MKKLFFCLFVFSICCVFAQEQRYFYHGDSILLQEDKNTIVLVFKPEFILKNDSNTFLSDNTIVEMDVSDGTEDVQFVRLTYSEQQNNILTTLLRYNIDTSQLEMFSFGYISSLGRVWHTNEIVIKFIQEIPSPKADSIVNRYDATLIEQDRYKVFTYKVKDANSVFQMANELLLSDEVEFAEPDFYQEFQLLQDPLFPEQYFLNNVGQIIDGTAGVVDMDIDAPEAWAITTGSSSIKVAVIDDGVERDPTHEDLPNVASGFTPNCLFNCDGRPRECSAHGQAVAGIIGATHNTIGVRGVSPNITIVPFRIFKSNCNAKSNNAIAKAINKAWDDFGCDVLSNSWGGGNPSNVITNAINNALVQGRNGKGSIVVFSAGNTSGSVIYPANLSGVLAVSAMLKSGNITSYSSHGYQIAVAAFGGSSSGDIRTTDRTGDKGYDNGNYTSTFNGTSAACPQVSGIAALLISRNPNLTGNEVSCRIRGEAIDMGTFNKDDDYGYGKANAHLTVAYDVMIIKDKTFTGFQRLCTNDKIETQNNVIIESGGNVSFRASNKIIGKSGFHAKSGSKAHAFISNKDPFCDCNECVMSPLLPSGSNIIVTACASTNSELCFTFKNAIIFGVAIKNTVGQVVYVNNGWVINDMACFNVPSLASGTYYFNFSVTGDPSCGNSVITNILYTVVLIQSNCKISNPDNQQTNNNIIHNNTEFAIYPNPSTGKISLLKKNSNNNEPLTVFIYNILGECIYQSAIHNPQSAIDLSSRPRGIYFLKIQTADPAGSGAGKIYTEKLIIQ